MPVLRVLALLALVLAGTTVRADEALVGVATNFLGPAEAMKAAFEAETPHRITLTGGSTGKLTAQIQAGSPVDVFLAADEERPKILEQAGLVVADSRFTYAIGSLVLWSADPGRVSGNGAKTLRDGEFRSLAIANPDLAPYGAAAQETLTALGLWDELEPKIVMGQNIGQTFALVATENADLGFVAASSLAEGEKGGSRWPVPEALHAPIRQDAVLLTRAENNGAARAFLDFLKSDEAREIAARFGYRTGAP